LAVVIQNEMQKHYPSLVAALGTDTTNTLSGRSAGSSAVIVGQLLDAQTERAGIAFYRSLKIMWLMYVAFAALRVGVVAFIRSQELSQDHAVTRTELREEEEEERREEAGRKRHTKNISELGKEEEVPKNL
jgi:hypothetical protein